MCFPGRPTERVTTLLSQELQAQLEEEVRSHEEQREEQAAMERRCVLLVSEGEETRAALESAERARKTLETELQEANEKYCDLNNQVSHVCALGSCKRESGIDYLALCSVPVSSEWEEEAGGGSPDSAAGARGAARRAEGIHRQSQEEQL